VKRVAAAIATVVTLVASGCATSFSPDVIRSEIARQTGADPQRAFELNLGPLTMAMTKSLLAGGTTDGALPLEGLDALELAVYEVPATGVTLDFMRMPVVGWEPVVRNKTPTGSALVLVRFQGDTISDLVLIGAGEKQAIYARLRGRLSRGLPAALGEAVEQHGTDGVKSQLMSLADEK